MGGKWYDKRQREFKERESFKKRIRRLREDLIELPSFQDLKELDFSPRIDQFMKLPPAQLNRILGFDKTGKKIIDKKAYGEACHLADFFSNHVGTVAGLIREIDRLYGEIAEQKKIIEHLEKIIEKKTGVSASVKIEPGLIFEPYPHMLYLTEQFICPKCKKSGFPVHWKGSSSVPARWLWLHFDEPEEMLEYSWKKPKIKTHIIKKGGLGNWWKRNTYQEEYSACFLFCGKGSKIQNSFLIEEGLKWTSKVKVDLWNRNTKE